MMPGAVGHSVLSSPAPALGAVFPLNTRRLMGGVSPFFQRTSLSIVNRSPNMFTLIGVGTGTAYAFSTAAVLYPSMFPAGFRGHGGYVRCISKRRQSSPRSYSWDRCWNCGRAAAPERRWLARSGAQDCASRSRQRPQTDIPLEHVGIGNSCGFAPEKGPGRRHDPRRP